MKDKRQRLALIWPYPIYDPSVAGAILAAASAYPAGHFAAGYGVGSAPYFGGRYSPYGSPATALHRPHVHQAAAPTYPHLLAHPGMPSLHLPVAPATSPGYAATSPSFIAAPSVGVTTAGAYHPSSGGAMPSSPSYAPTPVSSVGSSPPRAYKPQPSPTSSTSSSDSECSNGGVASVTPNSSNINNNSIFKPTAAAPPPRLLQPLRLVHTTAEDDRSATKVDFSPSPKQTISANLRGNWSKPARAEAPKLFQPYKIDVSESA